ncbi:MAG: hypothetical protein ACUVV0_04405 [Anaerolineae bacterium]
MKSPLRAFAGRWRLSLKSLTRIFGEIIYGMAVHDMVRDLNKERTRVEHLFAIIVFGDLLGIPVLPPYFSLRLLPYAVPHLETWRRSLLRERDLTDLFDQEIG